MNSLSSKKIEIKYVFEDLEEMNNFLHRNFFGFGMDFKCKAENLVGLNLIEFGIISSWNFDLE
jgi:hypothetical protein